jgi:hypothetical protein
MVESPGRGQSGRTSPALPPLPPMLGCWFVERDVEREFWKSDYCRGKLMMMERWGVVSLIVILTQKLVLGHSRKLLSNPRFDFWVIVTTTLVVGTRAVLSLFLPDAFWRNRQVVHCQRAASRLAPACPRTQSHNSPPPQWPRRRRVILAGRILRLIHLVTGIMLGASSVVMPTPLHSQRRRCGASPTLPA